MPRSFSIPTDIAIPVITVLICIFALIPTASAQAPTATIHVLFTFPCNSSFVCVDGYFPTSLVEAADGNFYGTASGGGNTPDSQGTVFEGTPTGQVTQLYSFDEGTNGALPFGSAPIDVVEGTDGFLYGTTLVNGAFGEGTIFKLPKTGGVLTDVHDFCSTEDCSDGANPGFLMQALDGNFYGDTGPNPAPSSVLYRFSANGTFQVLHTFDTKGQPDGTGTFAFTQATDGNFYGATVAGAQNNPFNTVFRFDPLTGAYKILHGFPSTSIAQSGLIQASNGELLGLQTNSVLYEISTEGVYKRLAPLSTTEYLDGELLQASDGNLWGDFLGGGCGDQGQVFSATTVGAPLLNLVFDCDTDGEQVASMFQAADGKFYGVTLGFGGVSTTNNILDGTIWVIDAGLPKPSPVLVNFTPGSTTVGAKVLLQGTHFVGTTSVQINGTPAAFRLLSANYISVTVPAAATSGKISITNAGGTTTSAKSLAIQ